MSTSVCRQEQLPQRVAKLLPFVLLGGVPMAKSVNVTGWPMPLEWPSLVSPTDWPMPVAWPMPELWVDLWPDAPPLIHQNN